MRLLLTAGANVNAANQNGRHGADVATHDAAKVRLLLGRGADVDAARSRRRDGGIRRRLRGNPQVVELLVPQEPTSARVRSRRPGLTLPQIPLTTNDP
jgi:hypothetical protein